MKRYIWAFPRRAYGVRALMHNHIAHDNDTFPGLNGFRVWTDIKPEPGFTVCHCGWASAAGTHYSHPRLARQKPKAAR